MSNTVVLTGKLNGKGDVAIAELAFFAPAFVVALFVFIRHGFSKSLGWFYLVTLSILRIIGASSLLWIETKKDYSVSLFETYAITSSIGTAPLLLALLGFMERVNTGLQTKGKAMPQPPFTAVHLLAIIALILAIVGGVEEPETPAAYAKPNTGKALVQAASILFMANWAFIAGLTILAFHRSEHVLREEKKLVWAGVAALPFLFVRVLYAVLVSFDVSSDFYYRGVNTFVEAFMQFMMEAIVVTMFIIAGILTPKMVRPQLQQPQFDARDQGESGMGGMSYQKPAMQQQQGGYGRQQRSLGDYRPSRLIRNAIANRN